MIRKATHSDIDDIVAIYEKILDLEEQGKTSIGWERGVYPTQATALLALEQEELFVCEKEGKLLATAIINHRQMPTYVMGHWKVEASANEVMVLHTLVVDPCFSGKGIGREFVAFYEQYAKTLGCKDLRMDTQEKNKAARSLYRKLGYDEIDIVACNFNGIQGVNLVLLEKAVL